MNIGKAISTLRKKKGYSQIEFAHLCGITQTYLSQIENGKKRPQEKVLTEICTQLEIPEAFLYFMSIDEQDIPVEKREAYKILGPTIKSLIEQLFSDTKPRLEKVG